MHFLHQRQTDLIVSRAKKLKCIIVKRPIIPMNTSPFVLLYCTSPTKSENVMDKSHVTSMMTSLNISILFIKLVSYGRNYPSRISDKVESITKELTWTKK